MIGFFGSTRQGKEVPKCVFTSALSVSSSNRTRFLIVSIFTTAP